MDDALRERARKARAEVESGTLRGERLIDLLHDVPALERDAWTDELLGIDAPPPDVAGLPRGAVPYLPCAVDEVLAMVRDVPIRPKDRLVDLGSGLGRVLILAHLLTGASACGVEIQEPLVRRARARCEALDLDRIEFVEANAAEVDLDGTVFFLYAPFNGHLLSRVVARLEHVARRRSIVVCAVDLELRNVPWLSARKASSVSLTIYDSRAG
ncbi:hypothetical protein AKJ09_07059 [Labilithrix luteola]|uniref:Methyltransferase domain-containing protein n=1 Tax=Labilithrix luteola TaxID=1391654 RepID=A0A0K1Q3H1_9BACT|nr:class I SAM-dependent methyltransferase [Labilithrix luteola]AKV00396.1 hypothetical protein AKJ09_07059 [Labilithrix luteola]